MPAFADALDLRFAVGDLVDNRTLSDVMPRLIQQAEVVLNRQLRTQWQIDDFSPAWTGNEAPLPADFLQFVGSNNKIRAVNGVLTRRPYYTCPADLEYYAKIPTISGAPSSTNWLLEQFPNAYLFAVSAQAGLYLRNPDMASAMGQALEGELSQIKIDDDRARYSNASVRVRGLTP